MIIYSQSQSHYESAKSKLKAGDLCFIGDEKKIIFHKKDKGENSVIYEGTDSTADVVNYIKAAVGLVKDLDYDLSDHVNSGNSFIVRNIYKSPATDLTGDTMTSDANSILFINSCPKYNTDHYYNAIFFAHNGNIYTGKTNTTNLKDLQGKLKRLAYFSELSDYSLTTHTHDLYALDSSYNYLKDYITKQSYSDSTIAYYLNERTEVQKYFYAKSFAYLQSNVYVGALWLNYGNLINLGGNYTSMVLNYNNTIANKSTTQICDGKTKTLAEFTDSNISFRVPLSLSNKYSNSSSYTANIKVSSDLSEDIDIYLPVSGGTLTTQDYVKGLGFAYDDSYKYIKDYITKNTENDSTIYKLNGYTYINGLLNASSGITTSQWVSCSSLTASGEVNLTNEYVKTNNIWLTYGNRITLGGDRADENLAINYACYSSTEKGNVNKNTVIFDGCTLRIATFKNDGVYLHKKTVILNGYNANNSNANNIASFETTGITLYADTKANSLSTDKISIDSNSIKFINSSDKYTLLSFVDPAEKREIKLPDSSGVLATEDYIKDYTGNLGFANESDYSYLKIYITKTTDNNKTIYKLNGYTKVEDNLEVTGNINTTGSISTNGISSTSRISTTSLTASGEVNFQSTTKVGELWLWNNNRITLNGDYTNSDNSSDNLMINYYCYSQTSKTPVNKNTVIYDGCSSRLAAFETNKITLHKDTLVSGGLTSSSLSTSNIYIDSDSIKFTNSSNYTKLCFTAPTAKNELKFPNSSGTLATQEYVTGLGYITKSTADSSFMAKQPLTISFGTTNNITTFNSFNDSSINSVTLTAPIYSGVLTTEKYVSDNFIKNNPNNITITTSSSENGSGNKIAIDGTSIKFTKNGSSYCSLLYFISPTSGNTTIMFPNASGTLALSNHNHDGSYMALSPSDITFANGTKKVNLQMHSSMDATAEHTISLPNSSGVLATLEYVSTYTKIFAKESDYSFLKDYITIEEDDDIKAHILNTSTGVAGDFVVTGDSVLAGTLWTGNANAASYGINGEKILLKSGDVFYISNSSTPSSDYWIKFDKFSSGVKHTVLSGDLSIGRVLYISNINYLNNNYTISLLPKTLSKSYTLYLPAKTTDATIATLDDITTTVDNGIVSIGVDGSVLTSITEELASTKGHIAWYYRIVGSLASLIGLGSNNANGILRLNIHEGFLASLGFDGQGNIYYLLISGNVNTLEPYSYKNFRKLFFADQFNDTASSLGWGKTLTSTDYSDTLYEFNGNKAPFDPSVKQMKYYWMSKDTINGFGGAATSNANGALVFTLHTGGGYQSMIMMDNQDNLYYSGLFSYNATSLTKTRKILMSDLSGNASITGTLSVTGDATAKSRLFVEGDTYLKKTNYTGHIYLHYGNLINVGSTHLHMVINYNSFSGKQTLARICDGLTNAVADFLGSGIEFYTSLTVPSLTAQSFSTNSLNASNLSIGNVSVLDSCVSVGDVHVYNEDLSYSDLVGSILEVELLNFGQTLHSSCSYSYVYNLNKGDILNLNGGEIYAVAMFESPSSSASASFIYKVSATVNGSLVAQVRAGSTIYSNSSTTGRYSGTLGTDSYEATESCQVTITIEYTLTEAVSCVIDGKITKSPSSGANTTLLSKNAIGLLYDSLNYFIVGMDNGVMKMKFVSGGVSMFDSTYSALE